MRCAVVSVVVLVLGGLSPASAGQNQLLFDGFETADTSAWWAPARVGETGQVTCWDAAGAVIPCAGTGQDGELHGGVAWPSPRFEDNGDGTVTDMLTGLVWLGDAGCLGTSTWSDALSSARALASGVCGLSDGSEAGDWRLPTISELQSVIAYEYSAPPLSDAVGSGQWSDGDPFSGVQVTYYWSSTSYVPDARYAWGVDLTDGHILGLSKTVSAYHAWPVRGVQ